MPPSQSRIPVLAVAGPTASGKSALAVRLARELDGEVISADSMQVYAALSLGTARPSEAEMQGVAHLAVPLTAEAHWGRNWLEAKG